MHHVFSFLLKLRLLWCSSPLECWLALAMVCLICNFILKINGGYLTPAMRTSISPQVKSTFPQRGLTQLSILVDTGHFFLYNQFWIIQICAIADEYDCSYCLVCHYFWFCNDLISLGLKRLLEKRGIIYLHFHAAFCMLWLLAYWISLINESICNVSFVAECGKRAFYTMYAFEMHTCSRSTFSN